MQFVLVYERALERKYAIGPFPSEAEAQDYAQKHHTFPQIWTVSELHAPETLID